MASRRRRVVTSKPGRSGCRTCRIRRVKCDEERPSCIKCKSTGRRCDGYEFLAPTRATAHPRLLPSTVEPCSQLSLLQPKTRSPDIRAGTAEDRAFDYFRFEGASALSSISPIMQWVRLSLQISHQEPAVYYAVTALAMEFENNRSTKHHVVDYPLGSSSLGTSASQFCKAASALNQYIDSAIRCESSVEPVLICCLLFVGFDIMCGRFSSATSHLRAGQRILKGNVQFVAIEQTNGPILKHSSRQVLEEINSVFDWLGNDVLDDDRHDTYLIEDHWDRSSGLPPSVPIAFIDLGQAKRYLNALCLASAKVRQELFLLAEERLVASGKSNTFSPAVRECIIHCLSRAVHLHSGLTDRWRTIMSAYGSWLSTLDVLAESQNISTSRSLKLLRLQHFVASATFQRYMEPHETAWDEQDFVQTLEIAKDIIGPLKPAPKDLNHPSPGLMPHRTFSLEPAVIPALSLVGFKCRDSLLRHRAIDLLKGAQRREGSMWSQSMAFITNVIAGIEEQRARELLDCHTPPTLDSSRTAQLKASEVPESTRPLDIVVSGEGVSTPRILLARFAHERGGELEVDEFLGSGYPMVFQSVGITTTGIYC